MPDALRLRIEVYGADVSQLGCPHDEASGGDYAARGFGDVAANRELAVNEIS